MSVSMSLNLPTLVSGALTRAITRVRRIRIIRGLAVSGIVWFLGVVTVMVVDSRTVIFDDRIRWALSGGVVAFTLLTSLFAIVLPLRRKTGFRQMATRLDSRHPEHEERLSSLVELSETDISKVGFSLSLYSMLSDLAERDLVRIDLSHEFPMKWALRWLWLWLLLLLTLIIGAVASPDLVGRLFVRAVAPWVDIGNLFSKEIVVRPGDVVALSGTVIRIEAWAASSVTSNSTFSIRLSRRRGLGWSEETTEPMPDGVYETTADLNEREWRYRVTAGPAVTRYYHVRVSQMPKYDLFTATVRYPDYTEMPPLVLSNADVTAIKAIYGSRVDFDVKIGDPGTLCDFRIGKEPVFSHTMVSNRTVNWSLDLVNSDGFRASKGKHPLTSYMDQPPTVVVEKPTGTLRLPPHAKIPVELTATDDIAVTSAYMRVSIDDEPWERHYGTHIDLSGNRRFLHTTADVDLSLYNLIFAKRIRFCVVVSDACPPEYGGPHSATSMPFTVQFAAEEANWEMRELHEEVSQAKRDIDEARKRLADARNLAREVRDAINREKKVSTATEQKSDRLAHELVEAEKRIEELRDEFLADERFEPLTRPLDRILDETLKPVIEEVENAPFRDREERAEEVNKAMPEMEKAVLELDDLTKRLTERAEKVDAFEKARDLAARQEALVQAAKDILEEHPADTAKLEAWKRLEKAAMKRVDELSKDRPDPEFAEARRMMETAARRMEDLKGELEAAAARAEQAKKEAEKRAKEQAAETARSAQELSNAANDQKAAEGALEKGDAAAAAKAQKAAADHLEKGEALPAVKEFQRQAGEEKTLAAQQEASAALKKEQDIREGIQKGTKKPADLVRLDNELRRELGEKAAARRKAAAAGTADAKAADAKEQAAAKAAEAKEQAAAKERAEAEAEQTKALDELVAAAKERTEELSSRRAGDKAGAAAKAKSAGEAAARAAKAQQQVGEHLKKGGATEGTKAMQKLAADAAQEANKSPRSAVKAGEALEAQREAQAALRQENAIREAIRQGEKTAADLEALDRGLRNRAKAKAEARAARAAEEARAEKAAMEESRNQDKELGGAVADQKRAAEAMKRRDFKTAESAQRAAEDKLERGEATEGVKALQQRASEALRQARKTPESKEKVAAAETAQTAAAEALRHERELREAIAKDELTAEDLADFDRTLKEGLRQEAQKATAAAAAAADEAVKAARAAVGSDETMEVAKLADAALEARRDAVAAELAETKLDGDESRGEDLLDEQNRIDNLQADAAEATARENQILSKQQSALDALQRGDLNRALKLQKEIAQAQMRAAEAVHGAEDAEEARAAANAAQAEAIEATVRRMKNGNNETKEMSQAAAKAAMEAERNAQEGARFARAMDKLSAAEAQERHAAAKNEQENAENAADAAGRKESGGAQQEDAKAAQAAAKNAADAMQREVDAQAAALGMSNRKGEKDARQGGKGKGDEDAKRAGGGGVSEEMKKLANDLKRKDSPDFFKNLFSRTGWFKIRGASKDGLSERDLKDVPREYRDLVRRYFLKLAEENPEPKSPSAGK